MEDQFLGLFEFVQVKCKFCLTEVDAKDAIVKTLNEELKQHISLIGDLERLISKVSTSRINPREMVQLKKALMAVSPCSVDIQVCHM